MRMIQSVCGLALGAVAGVTIATGALAQDFDAIEIKVHPVADNIYMLEGLGGNIGISVGDDGVLLIDDQFAPLTPKIKAAIETVTDKSVKFLFNTHAHFDHVGGNEQWGDMGAIIVAQENVRTYMQNDAQHPLDGSVIPASPAGALPVITFKEGLNAHWNGDDIEVHFIPAAHTSGDVFIHFKNADVIHGGDVANLAFYPIIDRGAGGSFTGYLAGQRAILAAMGPDTKLIPGHGALSTRQDLQDCYDMLITIMDRVAGVKAEHLPLSAIKTMGLTAEFDARWGMSLVSSEAIIETIYYELP